MCDLPKNVRLISSAFSKLGGETDLTQLYAEIRALDPEWVGRFRSDATFQATVRKIIEDHCPQSANYSPNRPRLFARTGRGKYRVMRPDEQRLADLSR
jgi:hypothetical protein